MQSLVCSSSNDSAEIVVRKIKQFSGQTEQLRFTNSLAIKGLARSKGKQGVERTGEGVPVPNLPRRYGLSGSVPSLKRLLPPRPPLPPPLWRAAERPAKPDGRLNHGRPDRSLRQSQGKSLRKGFKIFQD